MISPLISPLCKMLFPSGLYRFRNPPNAADRAIPPLTGPRLSTRQPSQPNSGIDTMGGGIVVWLAAMATIDVALTWAERPQIRFLAKS